MGKEDEEGRDSLHMREESAVPFSAGVTSTRQGLDACWLNCMASERIV